MAGVRFATFTSDTRAADSLQMPRCAQEGSVQSVRMRLPVSKLERLYLLAFLLTGERVELRLRSQAALRDSKLKKGKFFFFTA